MKIILLAIGKTDSREIQDLTAIFTNRIGKYIGFENLFIADVKRNNKSTEAETKQREAIEVKKFLQKGDILILFDERGKELSSRDFATFIQNKMNTSSKRIIFLIGGAYGFDKEIYDIADGKISLSRMTFSHQMVRLFATEQIYRAFTILNNEPYHHD